MTTPHPASDENTFDLIDDAVAALAERRGAWLGDDLSTIALITSLIEQAERWLPQLVHDARQRPLDRDRAKPWHQPRRGSAQI
jgi:hypothetical protein